MTAGGSRYCSRHASPKADSRPGLRERAGIWHIEKEIVGRKIHESTGAGDLKAAPLMLARRIEEARMAKVFGIRPAQVFRGAAARLEAAERVCEGKSGKTPALIVLKQKGGFRHSGKRLIYRSYLARPERLIRKRYAFAHPFGAQSLRSRVQSRLARLSNLRPPGS